ncbi:MAG: hypothetical protein SFY32_12390 [Bacteroidota bacterium]|nr:hypothetical protein [Bacteroidota bacterium]
MQLRQTDLAINYFEKYQKLNKGIDENQFEQYIALLKMKGYYTKAKNLLINRLKQGDNERLKNELIWCDSAIYWSQNPIDIQVKNEHKINTIYSELSPVFHNQNVVFSSNREGIIIQKKSETNNEPFYNLYFSKRNQDGASGNPKPFSRKVNTSEHETSVAFGPNNDKVFFSRIVECDQKQLSKLYSARYSGGKWFDIESFVFNEKPFSFTHPCIEQQGKMFFFASDMEGGYGGFDIYVCINMDEKWSAPINLGPKINTSGNEITPFYSTDGHLYFASDTHPGMGGFDLFIAHDNNGDWTNISNMKCPINSPMDDFGLTLDAENKNGLFSSNRAGGKGKEDIYSFIKP